MLLLTKDRMRFGGGNLAIREKKLNVYIRLYAEYIQFYMNACVF